MKNVFVVGLFFGIVLSVHAQFSSRLPIVLINTNGQTIPDEPKIEASMEILYNGPGLVNTIHDTTKRIYSGKIGIEIRGSSSKDLSPKKPFGIETRQADGTNLNISLLDMPKENDWALIAPYSDKTLIRDVLIYRIASEMMPYAPRTKFCEVLINGSYNGVYTLTEKIKQDKNRVNIPELLPNHAAGDALTGGYIIKIDKTTGSTPRGGFNSSTTGPDGRRTYYQFETPEADVITTAQKNYIQSLVNNFESSMLQPSFNDPAKGWRKYADENSMIDFLLLNELSNNVDGYRLSTYLYKDVDSKNKKLQFGPIWDFNLGFGNANYCSGGSTSVLSMDFGTRCPTDGFGLPFYWPYLFAKDSAFGANVYQRWTLLRKNLLSEKNILYLVDSLVEHLGEATNRNFQKWPILGSYVWPNNYVGGSYTNEINYLKNWISSRLIYLDGIFKTLIVPKYYPERYFDPKVFPNPAKAYEHISFQYYIHDYDKIKLDITDLSGKPIVSILDENHFNGTNQMRFNTISVPAGIYMYKLSYQLTGLPLKTGKLVVQ